MQSVQLSHHDAFASTRAKETPCFYILRYAVILYRLSSADSKPKKVLLTRNLSPVNPIRVSTPRPFNPVKTNDWLRRLF